ncbi:MAG: HAMP domain-containing histidine kinase [Tannerella sp.]|jgi:signal transduction histidine kinase|nr:HAMP domain-containing histidine kinase [Tannerella sp.]
MKRKIVYSVLIVSLTAIVANQVYWIVNMYHAYEKEIVLDMNTAIEKAAYMELTERSESGGGFFAFAMYPEKGDTSRFIKKTVRADDGSSFDIVVDRQDPDANLKIIQYALKDMVPLNVSRLNELFFREIRKSKFPVRISYVEHYDLRKDTLIASSRTDMSSVSYIPSGMITIDIIGSMGVKAYVDSPVIAILRRMIIQLVLSVVLIIIALVGLMYLGHTIFRQWKEEKMRRDSVDAMTHEFRRPISAAVTLVSLIPHYLEKNTAKVLQYAKLTMDELNKLTAYTLHIQQISNNDKSTISLDKSEIEIRPFLESLAEKYGIPEGTPAAGQNNKPGVIRFDVRPEHPALYADRLHFANVIENLVENAIKYNGDHPVVDITVDYQDEYLCISVKDNGIGISASDIKHVFDRFFRAGRREVRRNAGFGLGLTYVKSIVGAHGGRVEANSGGVGLGSEFVVFMPVRDHEII